jgi:hypothetical protein
MLQVLVQVLPSVLNVGVDPWVASYGNPKVQPSCVDEAAPLCCLGKVNY